MDLSKLMHSGGSLDGLLVLDLSRILAGPTATQMLGDLGATIIKIENPKTGGDDTRKWGPPYVETINEADDLSGYFIAANRNKFSVSADISTEEGQNLVRNIAAKADFIIENYKTGGLKKYGLDHETLCAAHPKLIYCSISGYGQTGPNSQKPGYDIMAQGFGGIMSLTGDVDGTPMKAGVGIADIMCGMYATIGMLAALRHRDQTGEGQHIDLALVDSQMAWLANEGVNYLTSGQTPERRGNAHPNIVPYEVFKTADGHVIIAVGNDSQYRKFCTALGLEALGSDPLYATNPLRIENRTALKAAILEAFAEWTSATILSKLEEAGVPCGPIQNVDQALTSEQAQAREMVVGVSTDKTASGVVNLLGNPLKFSKTPVSYRKAPPQFGEDNHSLEEILAPFEKRK